MSEQVIAENNSGMGKGTPVPEIIAKKFNWGAFFLSWIWGLGNATYITLVIFLAALIPFVGAFAILGCQIWFGIKGNEWAWQNKKYENVEKFEDYQRKWATAGVILFVVGLLCGLGSLALLFNATSM